MKAAREYPIVTVTAKGTRWLESGHPWVYDSDVAREPEESECENGALVDVVSEKGKYLGTGFLSRLSRLRVRIVSRNANDRFDENFWRRRVRYAWDYRKAVMDGQTGCCRLIFGEADAFPGLTVDRFETLLVTQTLSLGMEKIKDMLFPLIVEVLEEDGEKIDGLFERNDVVLREKEGLTQNKGWFALPGKETPASPITEICENGRFLPRGRRKRAEDRLFPRPEVQPPRRGAPCARKARARLLHAHGLLCAQRRQRRRGARDGGGRIRERGRNGARKRSAQRPYGQDGFPRRRRF